MALKGTYCCCFGMTLVSHNFSMKQADEVVSSIAEATLGRREMQDKASNWRIFDWMSTRWCAVRNRQVPILHVHVNAWGGASALSSRVAQPGLIQTSSVESRDFPTVEIRFDFDKLLLALVEIR